MNLLLHICCAPCVIHPLSCLRQRGHNVHGLFYNPNIHPYREYERRADTLVDYAGQCDLEVIWTREYGLEEYLRNVVHREEERCRHCYNDRLARTAIIAKKNGFSGFTTTLLYSRFQKHDLIREIGEQMGRRHGLPFLYVDFRDGWEEGLSLSREKGMYRQPYCGCVYSEKERYYRDISPVADH